MNEFVEFIPDKLDQGVLYVSMSYATASHSCACGCGREVVTPISPTDWRLSFDGVGISLHPSIGNWSFPCRSHYFIRGGGVQWAGDMSKVEIEKGRAKDRRSKQDYYSQKKSGQVLMPQIEQSAAAVSEESIPTPKKTSRWSLFKFFTKS